MNNNNINKLRLININKVSEGIQEQVRCIRNEPQIRKWMYTDHLISREEHRNWLERLNTDARNIVFVVTNDGGRAIGVVSANAIDYTHKKAEWAYYLTENARSGVGAVLEYFFIDYVFDALELEKLNCEVIEHNTPVVRLHVKFGFKQEGFRESNIIKDGERIGVHYLGLTRAKWLLMRNELKNKYSKMFSQYSVEFEQ